MMAVIVLAETFAGLVWFSVRSGIGMLIGGMLSFANYFWLKASLKAILENAAAGHRPRFLAGKYFLRYVVMAIALVFFHFAASIPATAMILGLASFAIAVVIEGILRIFTTSYK